MFRGVFFLGPTELSFCETPIRLLTEPARPCQRQSVSLCAWVPCRPCIDSVGTREPTRRPSAWAQYPSRCCLGTSLDIVLRRSCALLSPPDSETPGGSSL